MTEAHEGLAAARAQILADTFTTDALVQLLIRLTDWYEAHASEGEAAAAAVWGAPVAAYLAGPDRRERLAQLRHTLEALPTLVLYAPIALAGPRLAAIAAWCRTELDPTLLIDVRVDPAAVGGCSFVWKGVLYNFTLDHFLDKNAAAYDELLKRALSETVHRL